MSDKPSITKVLREATEGILSEEALTEIETVFEQSVSERAALHVEKALTEQDEDHSEKLEKLLEAIDTDHTEKLNKLVKAINSDHAKKLAVVAEKFNSTLNEDAGGFKDQLVENISNYLDLYIERAIPEADIKKAMKNTAATSMLKQLREALAVDNALAQSSIRGAVKDGKEKIDNLSSHAEQLSEKNETLTKELIRAQSNLVLEQKTKDLPKIKREYMFKVLGNKTPEFIEENYNYTLKLLEKTEEDRLASFKKEAEQKKEIVDRPTKKQTQVISENTQAANTAQAVTDEQANPLLSNYMEELQRA